MGEPRYQVVEFANGKFGVRDRIHDGYYDPPGFLDMLFGDTNLWWYSEPSVYKHSQMGQAKAMRWCSRLNARTTEAVSSTKVVRTLSCDK